MGWDGGGQAGGLPMPRIPSALPTFGSDLDQIMDHLARSMPCVSSEVRDAACRTRLVAPCCVDFCVVNKVCIKIYYARLVAVPKVQCVVKL